MLQLSFKYDFHKVILKIKYILMYSLRVIPLPPSENFWVLP